MNNNHFLTKCQEIFSFKVKFYLLLVEKKRERDDEITHINQNLSRDGHRFKPVSCIECFFPKREILTGIPTSGVQISHRIDDYGVLYGGLGFIGITFSRKLGFAEIWDDRVTNRQRFLIPGLIGAALGVFFIGADMILSRYHSLGNIPHPPFPTSLVASAIAGIGEEIIFRLFFISFWVMSITRLLLQYSSPLRLSRALFCYLIIKSFKAG